MKFIHYMEKVSGIDAYGLFSLSLFVTFFLVMLIMVFTMKSKAIDELKNIPLN
jgi:hypothetical protein